MKLKLKLKRGDNIKIIAGKFKDKTGLITKIAQKNKRVFVEIEGITRKKHQKPSQNEEGGIKDIPLPIEYSNVALIDPKDKKKVTKIGYKINKDGKKIRIARGSNSEITK